MNLQRFCNLFGAQGGIAADSEQQQTEGSSVCSVAPLFTGQVLLAAHELDRRVNSTSSTYPQYALLGILSDALDRSSSPVDKQRNLLFSNTNEPWSAFICGSQGSGKSHTLSCLLENALLTNSPAGVPQTASAGIIFHYDKFSGLSNGQICEAAYLCTSEDIEVRVLVAATSEKRLRKQYRTLPGIPTGSREPKVVPFYFPQAQLSIDTIMTLMAVQDTGINAPLYINVIRQLLREMALENQDQPGFSHDKFTRRLAHEKLTEGATTPLDLRLQLLRSVLLSDNQTPKTMALYEDIWDPKPGTLTIVDLSDAFINENDACALFSICLKLFMTGWHNKPRIIALDEAHKFLTMTAEAQKLIADLIAIVRQQRHFNSRVVVATQEPTVSAEFLDLCNVSIVHRFTSPQWFNTIKDHLAAAHADSHLFDTIVKLKTGQALVFSPTAIIGADHHLSDLVVSENRHLKVSIRPRVSADGGKSITAAQQHIILSEEDNEEQDSIEVKRIGNATLRGIATRANDTKRLTNLGGIAQATAWNPQSEESVSNSSNAPTVVGEAASFDAARAGSVVRDQPVTQRNVIVATHGKTILTKTRLESGIRSRARKLINAQQVQDPSRYCYKIIAKIENEYTLPKGSLWKGQFIDGDETMKVTRFLHNIIKSHYDEQGVENSKRADLPWLRA